MTDELYLRSQTCSRIGVMALALQAALSGAGALVALSVGLPGTGFIVALVLSFLAIVIAYVDAQVGFAQDTLAGHLAVQIGPSGLAFAWLVGALIAAAQGVA